MGKNIKAGKKKSISNRFKKGSFLKNKIIINSNNNFLFNIPSESNPNIKYSITFKNNKLSCNCGLQFIGEERNKCKHIAGVLLKLIKDYDESVNVNDINNYFKNISI